MIRVTLWRAGLCMVGFRIEGHAGAGVHGQDIVCAAVSVLGQAIAGGLDEVVDARPSIERREGFLECRLAAPAAAGPGAQALLGTLQRALADLAGQHPKRVAVRSLNVEEPDEPYERTEI